MSFSGNLEHLPIVDVMQLLETTKKSGTLLVKNDGIEYKIGFNNGFIVSASHPDNLLSLSQLLSFKNIINKEKADEIVQFCKNNQKTMTFYLFENQILDTKSIKDLLTNFVEMTVVDILTWPKGSFHLSVDETEISDEFKSFSIITKNDLYISTQNTLMESLRLFDELRRDNLLTNGFFQHQIKTEVITNQEFDITEDILGLDSIDKLERKIPDVFLGIKEIDYTETHRKKILERFPNIAKNQEEEFVNFLAKLDVKEPDKISSYTIIYFGKDDFLSHVVNIICKSLGIFIFSTDAQENLEIIIKQSKLKGLKTILIIDSDNITETEINFDDITFIYFKKNCEEKFILNQLQDKAMVVFPKPDEKDIQNQLLFYNSILNYFKRLLDEEDKSNNLKEIIEKITESSKISDITNHICNFLSEFYERVIAFIIHQGFLVTDKCLLPDLKTLSFKLPFNKVSKIFELKNEQDANPFIYDVAPENPIYQYIPVTKDKKYFLMALKAIGKTITFIYCDNEKKTPDFSMLQIIQKTSNIQIENILYRKMFEKSKKTE